MNETRPHVEALRALSERGQARGFRLPGPDELERDVRELHDPRSTAGHRLALASAVLAVLAVGALASRGGPADVDTTTATAVDVSLTAPAISGVCTTETAPPQPTGTRLSDRSQEDLDRMRASMTPDELRAFDQTIANEVANRHAVGRPGGVVGFVTNDAFDAPNPARKEDLFPVLDATGLVVGYWGSEVGTLTIAERDDPSLTMEDLKQRVGTRTETTLRDADC